MFHLLLIFKINKLISFLFEKKYNLFSTVLKLSLEKNLY